MDTTSVLIALGEVTAFVIAIAIIVAFLRRREYIIRAVGTDKPRKRGDLLLTTGLITVRTALGPKQFKIEDIQSIEGYEEIDAGLEHHSCIDVIFSDGEKLLFCGTNITHQQLLNELLTTHLHVAPVNWEQGYYGPFTTEIELLYEKVGE